MTCTEQSFLKDVDKHQMTVLRDDGVHRHVRFRKPDSVNMAFELITWPGHLCYSGDMGTYVFRRLHDMFEFFRTDRLRQKYDGRTLIINLDYWSQKCISVDCAGGIEEYSADKFRQRITEILDENGASAELRQAVEDEVLSCADYSETEAYRAAEEFEHNGFRFTDFWEVDLKEYSYRFVWCCYALAWGIQQYDDRNVPVAA
jgi:hypothetical protein